MTRFAGFDHIDCRVRSLAAVESFYDALMPEIGLPLKRFSHVDEAGEWHDATHERPYNTVEYFESPHGDAPAFFMGLIERHDHVPGDTRIAFRIEAARLDELEALLDRIGATAIERSTDEPYQAIFFEDPSGTKLEVVGR